jgi:PAS domain S-box-containing protein
MTLPDNLPKIIGRMLARLRSRALWIALGYAVFATLWIFFSDSALALLVDDPAELVRWSVAKGFAFVLVTSGLLLLLMRHAFGAMEAGYGFLEAQQSEIRRLNRLYAALSHINQAIVRESTREALFHRICSVLVEHGGFRLAWVGWHNAATHQLEPVASAGDSDNYIQTIQIYGDDRPLGRGPTGRAFRSGQPYVCNDTATDPATAPWREQFSRRGLRASVALPVRHQGEIVGVLSVYADEPGVFHDRELALLTEATQDMAFALDNVAREEQRRDAEASAQHERQFSDTMIESMPGVLYFYDLSGHFLRWNRNFEQISGYTAAEIAGMHPLDFFFPADRPLVEARIAEVFKGGESSVEAPFRTKTGGSIPYFFTGRRVVFEERACLVGVGIDVSEHKRTEAALMASEQRYRTTLDSIMEGCQLLDHGWRYLYLNAAAAAHNRRPESELLGRTLMEAWPGIEQTRAYALMRMAMHERVAIHEEIPFRFPDGSTAWFDMRCQPVPEGVFLLSIDVTERREAEAALQEIQGRMQVVVDNLREGLIIADPASDFLHWNPAALRLLGFADPGEGRQWQRRFAELFEITLLDGSRLPLSAWPLARVREGESFDALELRVRRIDRDWERIFSYSGAQVTYAGDRKLAFLTLSDITARKHAEQLLRETNETLERKVAERTEELMQALTRAESADRTKSAFLATMSHELRTPLNSIIGFTGIVLQGLAGPLTPEQSKQLGMVRTSARHLLELINDVLDISKIEAGQLEFHAEPFELPDSLQRVVQTIRPLADKKGLALDLGVGADLGSVIGDRRRTEQILLNLLNNAVKFTERGRVSLQAERVTLPGATPGAPSVPGVRLRVSDTGIGIKSSDLPVLFQPFRQIDSGLSRQHEGTGLGLAICRRLATLMQGDITATSEWGHGSVFTVVLPLPPSS